jgi:hypothetical protein
MLRMLLLHFIPPVLLINGNSLGEVINIVQSKVYLVITSQLAAPPYSYGSWNIVFLHKNPSPCRWLTKKIIPKTSWQAKNVCSEFTCVLRDDVNNGSTSHLYFSCDFRQTFRWKLNIECNQISSFFTWLWRLNSQPFWMKIWSFSVEAYGFIIEGEQIDNENRFQSFGWYMEVM